MHDFFTLKERSRSKIIQTLKKVSLNNTILQQQFTTLSTGQFQRMLLAWVIIDNPSVLLLDEPLSSIDIGGEKTIYSLLHNLWKTENFTLLLVTHDINVVWEHATHVLCLNKHLLCYTTPEKITPDLLTKLYGTTVTFHEHRNG
ncbi:MAG: ATP-binding cassette domain-containing protein [Candidatus Babeliales bacterium]